MHKDVKWYICRLENMYSYLEDVPIAISYWSFSNLNDDQGYKYTFYSSDDFISLAIINSILT